MALVFHSAFSLSFNEEFYQNEMLRRNGGKMNRESEKILISIHFISNSKYNAKKLSIPIISLNLIDKFVHHQILTSMVGVGS